MSENLTLLLIAAAFLICVAFVCFIFLKKTASGKLRAALTRKEIRFDVEKEEKRELKASVQDVSVSGSKCTEISSSGKGSETKNVSVDKSEGIQIKSDTRS